MSADGRFIAFESVSADLVPDDTNGEEDCFVKDTTNGQLFRVSTDSLGAQASCTGANLSISGISISGDGRFVAFSSSSPTLAPSGDAGIVSVFLKDRATNETTLISSTSEGTAGNATSFAPAVSNDGRQVAFVSDATNLVAGGVRSPGNVFVKNRVTGAIRLVSCSSDGTPANGWTYRPSISADGSKVAFSSSASSLVPNDTNDLVDQFVKDLDSGETARVSTASNGQQGNHYSDQDNSISGSGRYVAFTSQATNFGMPNGFGANYRVYLKDLQTGQTTGLAANPSGTPGTGYDMGPVLSSNGRYVAFLSSAPDLVSDDTNGLLDVFVKEIGSPVTPVPDSHATDEPVLVLVAGLNSNTGWWATQPWAWSDWETNDSNNLGDPWAYIGQQAVARDKLGASDVLVMPTKQGISPVDAGRAAWGYCINSTGRLEPNIRQLAGWLGSSKVQKRINGRPVILIGHSYGGVIARSMLARENLNTPNWKSTRKQIRGIIQLGSPNGGSGTADEANKGSNEWMMQMSDATQDLSTSHMRMWNKNKINKGRVGVPVRRLGGTYLPKALDSMPASTGDDLHQWIWAHDFSSYNGNLPNDGALAIGSLKDAFGVLDDALDRDFGGGKFSEHSTYTHSAFYPGTNRTYNGVKYRELVPQKDSNGLMPEIAAAIASIGSRDTASRSAGAGRSQTAAQSAEIAGSDPGASVTIPRRTVLVSSDATSYVTIPLDGSASIRASSRAGTPTVTVHDEDGTLVGGSSGAELGTDGTVFSFLRAEPANTGRYAVGVTLPSGVSGEVVLGGVVTGGAKLLISGADSPVSGTATTLTAGFAAATGVPLTNAIVTGIASSGGYPDVALVFRDNGLAPDTTASDGIYAAVFTPPVPGRWLAHVQGAHQAAERVNTIVFDVGDEVATVTGSIGETTTPGPGETLAALGVEVPIRVSVEGTYTLVAVLSDAAGRQIGSAVGTASLASDESATIVATIDASPLSVIIPGRITVEPLLIYRETDGVDLYAGSGPGLTTTRSYSAADFYAFSVSLDGPAANPSPTSAVHFTGTALNTSSTVANVEYSIDGSETWHPATVSDGAFDSHSEDFSIDLELPDYVYGILVRQTGSDGAQLPVPDWAGRRFTIDTTAPATAADLAAVLTTEAGPPVARTTWLPPSDSPSDTASTVRYEVGLDGVDTLTTYDTGVDLPLPDSRPHTLNVTPIDAAGNTGPTSTCDVAGTWIPTYVISTSVPLGHGSIAPSGTVSVDEGSSLTCTITPDIGYHTLDVTVDGKSIGASSSVTFANISTDRVISATFAINNFRLGYVVGSGGTLTGVASQTVEYNGAGTPVTAVPSANYRFVSWSDGKTAATRTEATVTADATYTATFAKDIKTASIARTPNRSSVTYTRKRGVARFTLSASIKGWGSKAVAGHYVYLQSSKTGKSWSNTYRIKTGLTGRASKSFKITSKRTRYYRWYVPAKLGVCLKTYSRATKVTVK
ncbi:MAG: hypothetical protein HGB10_08475 [Coriobacteriia bacterium]|nr:hypothetical protein [Coriobacteriia bacterium]